MLGYPGWRQLRYHLRSLVLLLHRLELEVLLCQLASFLAVPALAAWTFSQRLEGE